jgi:zinc protease
MNKRKTASPILLGLALLALIIAAGLYLLRSSESKASQALDQARSCNPWPNWTARRPAIAT